MFTLFTRKFAAATYKRPADVVEIEDEPPTKIVRVKQEVAPSVAPPVSSLVSSPVSSPSAPPVAPPVINKPEPAETGNVVTDELQSIVNDTHKTEDYIRSLSSQRDVSLLLSYGQAASGLLKYHRGRKLVQAAKMRTIRNLKDWCKTLPTPLTHTEYYYLAHYVELMNKVPQLILRNISPRNAKVDHKRIERQVVQMYGDRASFESKYKELFYLWKRFGTLLDNMNLQLNVEARPTSDPVNCLPDQVAAKPIEAPVVKIAQHPSTTPAVVPRDDRPKNIELWPQSSRRVWELIQQNKHLFRKCPVGPAIAHIKVRHGCSKWALAIENVCFASSFPFLTQIG